MVKLFNSLGGHARGRDTQEELSIRLFRCMEKTVSIRITGPYSKVVKRFGQ